MQEPDMRTPPPPTTTIAVYKDDHAVLLALQRKTNPDRWAYSMPDLVHDLLVTLAAQQEAGDTP